MAVDWAHYSWSPFSQQHLSTHPFRSQSVPKMNGIHHPRSEFRLYHGGLFPVRCARKTSKGWRPGGILIRWTTSASSFLQSGFFPSSVLMSKLLTRKPPNTATLFRKLILVAYIHGFILFLSPHKAHRNKRGLESRPSSISRALPSDLLHN